MKAYTGTGDKGQTHLYGGTLVWKDDPRVQAYGAVDELNCQLGLARAHTKDDDSNHLLKTIQDHLFILGGDLANELVNAKIPRITKAQLEWLESTTDRLNSDLPELKRFIIPGGKVLGAQLHVARAVCRRTEGRIVELSNKESINPVAIPYVNRLSSFLFVFARFVNRNEGVPEDEWDSKKYKSP